MDRDKLDSLIKRLKELRNNTISKRRINIGDDDDCGGDE